MNISADGQFITIATWEQFFSIMVTEDLRFEQQAKPFAGLSLTSSGEAS